VHIFKKDSFGRRETGQGKKTAGFIWPRLGLYSLSLEECLVPAGTSRVDLYHQSLFIKFSVQLAWDTPGQPFFAIICIPQEVIAVHEKLSPTIENIAVEYSSAARFHSFSKAAIVYQIFD